MPKYKSVQVEVPEIGAIGLDQATTSQLDDFCRAYRLVQDTPIDFRGILPPPAAELFEKPETVDATKGKIKERLDQVIEPIADRLPERVLGKSWDLRKTKRETRKVNEDRLKFLLLQLGFVMEMECPPTVAQETVDLHPHTGAPPSGLVDLTAVDITPKMVTVICPHCNGTGRRRLTGLDAINHLIREVTDESVSVSWSVYKLKETEGG